MSRHDIAFGKRSYWHQRKENPDLFPFNGQKLSEFDRINEEKTLKIRPNKLPNEDLSDSYLDIIHGLCAFDKD